MQAKTEIEKKYKWTRKLIIFILTIICCNNGAFAQQDFLLQQRQYARVKTAVTEKEQTIAENLRKNELSTTCQ